MSDHAGAQHHHGHGLDVVSGESGAKPRPKVSAKLSNNQHKVDQAWDWLKRIWIAWMIINGIGAFIAYVTPLLNTRFPSSSAHLPPK